MKPLLILLCCLSLFSCSKTNTPKNDFRINGVSDVNTRQDTSVNIGLAVAQATGTAEQVNLAISGLPDKVGYKFSSQNGIPDFSSVLTLTIGYSAPAGTYAVKIMGTSAAGLVKEYPFNLKIDTVANCVQGLLGTYAKNPNDCQGYMNGPDAVIEQDSLPGKIRIRNFMFNGTATAKLDCEHKQFTLDQLSTGLYYVTGTGSFANGIITMNLHFAVIITGPPPKPDCTTTMTKK